MSPASAPVADVVNPTTYVVNAPADVDGWLLLTDTVLTLDTAVTL